MWQTIRSQRFRRNKSLGVKLDCKVPYGSIHWLEWSRQILFSQVPPIRHILIINYFILTYFDHFTGQCICRGHWSPPSSFCWSNVTAISAFVIGAAVSVYYPMVTCTILLIWGERITYPGNAMNFSSMKNTWVKRCCCFCCCCCCCCCCCSRCCCWYYYYYR